MPSNGRIFVLTFGYTHHNLKDDCYEYDFGIRTTLNAIDPTKLKSTDTFQPESLKRERVQIPIASELNFFDFNQNESIVKTLTGYVKEEYKEFFTSVTGTSSLKVTSKISSDKVSKLCSDLLTIYNKEDFKKTFPDIQNIIPVKDPDLLCNLNKKLVGSFGEKSINLVLSIPEIIDYTEPFKIKYTGEGKDKEYYLDVYIDT